MNNIATGTRLRITPKESPHALFVTLCHRVCCLAEGEGDVWHTKEGGYAWLKPGNKVSLLMDPNSFLTARGFLPIHFVKDGVTYLMVAPKGANPNIINLFIMFREDE
jgi:hypothetical protein